MNKRQIWVVVAAYNEEKYLKNFLEKLLEVTKNVVVVNDGSIDQTGKIAEKMLTHVLHHPVNIGKGAAMKTGADYVFDYLGGEAVVFMDGDGQHDPADLAGFERAFINEEAGLVFGSREFNSTMPMVRVWGNKLSSLMVATLFGRMVPDIPSGFKGMSKSYYKKLRWQSTDYGVELEIACKTAKYRLRFKEVPIQTIYHDMDRGMTLLDVFKMAYKIILWRINL